MVSVLDAFGIQDPSILTDRDRLITYLALDNNRNEGGGCCSEALVSTVVALVNVVYSMESRLEELEREAPKSGTRPATGLNLKRARGAGSSETESESRGSGSVRVHSVNGEGAGESNGEEDLEELGADGSRPGYRERGLDEEDEDDDGDEEDDDDDDDDDENQHTDDSEGDLDDDLNAVFDSTGVSDFTEHPVPTNFTYNYKPQQVTNLKMPTNVPAGEKVGRTISVINWTDVPLSQIALKYNVSKSVIGPTLQVLRDFEKRNTKALQESIKRSRAATEERELQKVSEEKAPAAMVGTGTVKDAVSSKPVRSRRRELNAHKIRLRLRSKRRRGSRRSDDHHDESSSESVYDPNYRSDEEEKENRRVEDVEGEKRAKDVPSKRPAANGSSSLLNGDGNESSGLKRVKFGENIEHSKDRSHHQGSGAVPQTATGADVQPPVSSKHRREPGVGSTLSNSLYSLLQSASTSQPADELVGSAKQATQDPSGNGSVPVFAYALTSSGQYQCKSQGCDVKPFGQYIQLYKHKATQHPQELPS
ncbi:hypothetical protein PICMEDRAFT_11896 [Pichia membranifaciens NRRL Y-2026]|uniref:Uncharacterized protein n=1 Tax=Pichia membranifaciens NRRL Y-2026 TaxID=763406 RepID=A0A1E3NLD1_9ASCO|nr:hypothetical protein PICMEDRAFT_11896 [Pichia membranifaciens NRRL Y-2026]ODQ46937.1 hypothetical protein PICMEDRAFT_11896 [Pichia membranifaciens NRRL Y-2026]